MPETKSNFSMGTELDTLDTKETRVMIAKSRLRTASCLLLALPVPLSGETCAFDTEGVRCDVCVCSW